MSNYEYFCSDCKKDTEVVFDHSAGDTVCSECGLVLESGYIDEASEWRTFANDSNYNDCVRVGEASNPLFGDAISPTMISKPNRRSGDSTDSVSPALSKLQNRGADPEIRLLVAFKSIGDMCDRLGLLQTIKDLAHEIYKRVLQDQKSTRGRKQDALLAACLYVACRQEDKPRTVKEICSVAEGSTKKEIGRATKFIVKQLDADMGQHVEMKSIHAGDFMRRFCSNLRMSHDAVKAAREAVLKAEEIDIRRTPLSIAAIVIYMVAQLSGDNKSLKDISDATGAAEGTIRSAYKDIYPHASRIIPTWYAKQEDIRNLISP